MRKKFFFILFSAVVLPLLILLVMELGLRIFVHFRCGKPGKSYGIYKADKELGAVHRPNSYNCNSVINNWGFRNANDINEQKLKGSTRIYCSGGSTTFCYNLPTEEAWPSLLQKKLRTIRFHENDEVLNGGAITFAVANEFALARRTIPRLKPDIVILYGNGINEYECASTLKYVEKKDLDRLFAEKKWGVFSSKLDQSRFLKRNSVLVKAVEYSLVDIKTKIFKKKISLNRESPHPWIIENFKQTLSAYIDFLHSHGCKIILVLYGDNAEGDAYSDGYILPFRDLALEIGRKKHVYIFNFADKISRLPLQQRKSLFYSPVHLNKQGAELLSSELVRVVLSVAGNKRSK